MENQLLHVIEALGKITLSEWELLKGLVDKQKAVQISKVSREETLDLSRLPSVLVKEYPHINRKQSE